MRYNPNPPGTTRSTLLKNIGDPDNEDAWNRFFDLYAGFIYNLARRNGVSDPDADELIPSVLLEVARLIIAKPHDPAKGNFRDLLATVTRRRIIDRIRVLRLRATREVSGFDQTESRTGFILRQADLDDDPFKKIADEEWLALLRERALAELKADSTLKTYSIFHAAVIEEWPTEKIMTTYGVTRDVVYQTRRRLTPRYAEILRRVAEQLESPPAP